MKPVLQQVANLWTLIGHPTAESEWSLDQKLQAIKQAGFDAVCWAPSPELTRGCEETGLQFVGGMASGDAGEFPQILRDLQRSGAHHVNVQLGADTLETPEALQLTLTLLQQAATLGVEPAIESHRGTCTETPEKMYRLADAYEQAIGKLLPISWDFSHFAVVKHLVPENFVERLLVRPDLIQRACQFHFRPFNGHHAQVPITNSDGSLTKETRDWLPFAEKLLRVWLDGHREDSATILICPELGPVEGGYALSTFPNSWEDAKVLRGVIAELWERVTGE